MESDTLAPLIAAIRDCNEQLYHGHKLEAAVDMADKDSSEHDAGWQLSIALIEQRALLLQQLSVIIPSLDQTQINRVGQLYQAMLDTDKQYMARAQSEQLKVRNALRAIKNAEKALPLYKINSG